jgi:hypothetical protein
MITTVCGPSVLPAIYLLSDCAPSSASCRAKAFEHGLKSPITGGRCSHAGFLHAHALVTKVYISSATRDVHANSRPGTGGGLPFHT